MKRKVVFLWGPVATLAILAAIAGLVRLHLAEAAEVLLAELTGAGAEVGEVDVAYFPPCVTVHDFKMGKGSERVEAPRIDLYPDFSRILDGEMSLGRAMFSQPIVRTSLSADSEGSLDPGLLPKIINIRDASFIVDDNGIPASPISFSADLEKGDKGIAFAVRSVSIPEFGLTFSGQVDVGSISPLKLNIDAEKGAFNPSALLDFLRRFEYLDDTALTMFSDTKAVFAERFDLDFDARTRSMSFAAGTFVIGGSSLSDFEAGVDADGAWAVSCSEGKLDAAQLLALAASHPDGGEALTNGLRAMGLKSLEAEGSVSLKDVRVQSRGATRPSGTMSLSSPCLKVHLVSEKGETQDMVLNDLDGVVTIENGKPTVSINTLELASSVGGEATVTGALPVPFALAGTRFLVEARQFNWFGTQLDGSVAKKSSRQVDFDLKVRRGESLVKARGLARNEYGGVNKWAAVVEDLIIETADREEKEDESVPFDFRFVRDGTLSGTAAVRRLKYNDMPVVRDMSVKATSVKGRTVLKGRGRLCLMKVGFDAVLTTDSVASKIAVKGNGVHLPGVLGCFVDELPVYIRGRLTFQANLFMQGKTMQEVNDSIKGDALARFRDLNVLKLSNLDPRLGFFLEIINAVGLEPDKGDTLSFRDGMIAASVRGDEISLKSVRLGGSQVSVSGKGQFGTGDKRLRLDALVATPFGTRKNISIDRVLSGEKAS